MRGSSLSPILLVGLAGCVTPPDGAGLEELRRREAAHWSAYVQTAHEHSQVEAARELRAISSEEAARRLAELRALRDRRLRDWRALQRELVLAEARCSP